MAVVLLILGIFAVAVTLDFADGPERRLPFIRHRILECALIFSLLTYGITEGLSLFRWLSFPGVFISWFLVCLFGLFLFLAGRGKRRAIEIRDRMPRKLSRLEIALIIAMVFILLATLVTALMYPPNNWDSMTYHLSRVANWMEHQSTRFYPTSNPRQIVYQPMAEFLILHTMVLSASDFFANGVQWTAFLLSILGISLIAEELGANRKTQIVTAAIGATLPMAILQASSTQNDLVATLYIVAFSYFILRLRKEDTLRNIFFAGTALGLAMLTKGYAYVFCLPVFMLYVVRNLRFPWLLARTVLVFSCLVLVLNGAHYVRNTVVYGHPLGDAPRNHSNEVLSWKTVVSNMTRDIAWHLSSPSTTMNDALFTSVDKIHRMMGLDINDPKMTWQGTNFTLPPSYCPHEDMAQNFTTTVLLLFSIPFFFLAFKRGPEKMEIAAYLLAVVFSYVLFSLMLKWMPWNSRLHTPVFFLLAPFLALAWSQYGKILSPILAGLLLFSLPFLFLNLSRPLIHPPEKFIDGLPFAERLKPRFHLAEGGRTDRRFINFPELRGPYLDVIEYVKDRGFEKVGLLISGDDWDYPFLYLLRKEKTPQRMFRYVNVTNPSSNIASENWLPDCIIRTQQGWETLNVSGNPYRMTRSSGMVSVLEPASGDAPS